MLNRTVPHGRREEPLRHEGDTTEHLVFVFTCMVGLITPPVGVVLFMACALVELSMETLSRAIVPFVVWMVIVAALLIVVPPLTLFLPGLVGFR